MEQTDAKVTSANPQRPLDNGSAVAPSGDSPTGTVLSAQVGGRASNPNGDGWGMTHSYVYAIGRVEPRFPRLEVEKEFAQATGRADTAGLTDRQALHAVLSERQNRYLVRQLCW